MAQLNDIGLDTPGDFSVFNIVSFNLHGLNSGLSQLQELCLDPDTYIIAVQEHWLTPNGLMALNNIHPDFSAFGISAMNYRLTSGIYRGRPFGGVAFLWRKSISDRIHVVSNDPQGRCLCIELKVDNNKVIKLITVYFPCFSPGVDYANELGRCLGCIENDLN